MGCECAEMDWTGIDMKLEHHPDCDRRYVHVVGDPKGDVERGISDEGWDRRRLGRFSVPHEIYIRFPGAVMRLMGKMIVLRAEPQFDTRAIDYLGEGPLFDPVPDCQRAPDYDIEYTDGDLQLERRQ